MNAMYPTFSESIVLGSEPMPVLLLLLLCPSAGSARVCRHRLQRRFSSSMSSVAAQCLLCELLTGRMPWRRRLGV